MHEATHFQAKRRLLAVIAASALVALVSAALSIGAIGLVPPGLGSPSQLHVAVATTHVMIDSGAPSVVHQNAYPNLVPIKRAELLGRVVTSRLLLEQIGRRVGVDPDQIDGSARTTASVPLAFTEPSSEQRAADIYGSHMRYRLEAQARLSTPILDVSAEAPSKQEAERLANAADAALRDYLAPIAKREKLAARESVQLRQLGSARGTAVDTGAPVAIALLTFVVIFALAWPALLFVTRGWRGVPPVRRPRRERDAGDAWPNTTRLLPWTLAGFLAVLWLVPFNQIQLSANLPIDLKFDRLVLPFVLVTWAIAMAVGGRMAPRFQFTWIHAAIGAFVICAFLSVIVNARYLNQTLELDRAMKQLPLLVAYVSLFVIASTGVRSTEVRAFMTYTLVLAVICAIGILWEYRFEQNLFYDWSDKILPGIFTVHRFDAAAVDDIGRRLVSGPTAIPLEAVATLSMALPIALVRLVHAPGWRGRILYALAICLLMSATFATFRKSALLAPAAVVLTMAYFRRRELLKLSPLALVLVVIVHVLAPGALGSTTDQFDPGRLGVTTVSDRASDYDAVRPDIWTHLILGRGWGSYDHVSYRILDSEILHRAIEMGVFGALAFLAMGVSVVASARATIASRDPRWAPPALIGAAGAVSFMVVSALFDVLSFPHPTYIFLFMAGIVAVVVKQHREHEEPLAAPVRALRGHADRPGSAVPRRRSPDEPAVVPLGGYR